MSCTNHPRIMLAGAQNPLLRGPTLLPLCWDTANGCCRAADYYPMPSSGADRASDDLERLFRVLGACARFFLCHTRSPLVRTPPKPLLRKTADGHLRLSRLAAVYPVLSSPFPVFVSQTAIRRVRISSPSRSAGRVLALLFLLSLNTPAYTPRLFYGAAALGPQRRHL